MSHLHTKFLRDLGSHFGADMVYIVNAMYSVTVDEYWVGKWKDSHYVKVRVWSKWSLFPRSWSASQPSESLFQGNESETTHHDVRSRCILHGGLPFRGQQETYKVQQERKRLKNVVSSCAVKDFHPSLGETSGDG